jgi:hypothetical protein
MVDKKIVGAEVLLMGAALTEICKEVLLNIQENVTAEMP